jgi:hypothetical protein
MGAASQRNVVKHGRRRPDIARMEQPPPTDAFGRAVPPWASKLRMAVLLACLAGAVFALLATNDVFSGGASSGEASEATGRCGGGALPEVAPVGAAGAASLRQAALGVFAARHGKIYEEGAVGSRNLFTDGEPRLENAAVKQSGGGYEVRRWALDAEGRGDDVVVDALHFRDPEAARRALDFTVSERCRRSRSARPEAFPPGAWSLVWVNPDGAYQQDTLFVRGAELYRVSDVPPGTGSRMQDAGEHARVALTTNALACALPLAGCNPATARGVAERAGLPASTGADPSARWPPDAARANAYVQAVAVHPDDVSYTRSVAHARGAGLLESTPRTLAGCSRGSLPQAVASASSPLFIYGSGRERQSVESLTALFGNAGQAARLQAGFADALGDGCARLVLERRMHRLEATHPDVRFSDLRLSPLPAPGPDRYGDIAPELASAQRVSYVAAVGTPRGGFVRLHEYEEGFVLAYKRAVVELTIATAAKPLPQANRNYLERALLGRAVARWGAPAGPSAEPTG